MPCRILPGLLRRRMPRITWLPMRLSRGGEMSELKSFDLVMCHPVNVDVVRAFIKDVEIKTDVNCPIQNIYFMNKRSFQNE